MPLEVESDTTQIIPYGIYRETVVSLYPNREEHCIAVCDPTPSYTETRLWYNLSGAVELKDCLTAAIDRIIADRKVDPETS